jgi:hypothetical protein
VIDTAWGLYREEDGGGATLEVTGREVERRKLPLEFDRRCRGRGPPDVWKALRQLIVKANREAEEALKRLGV